MTSRFLHKFAVVIVNIIDIAKTADVTVVTPDPRVEGYCALSIDATGSHYVDDHGDESRHASSFDNCYQVYGFLGDVCNECKCQTHSKYNVISCVR
jgi:hypothetical protein